MEEMSWDRVGMPTGGRELNLLPKEPIESFWGALWLGIQPFLCFDPVMLTSHTYFTYFTYPFGNGFSYQVEPLEKRKTSNR